MSDAASGKVCVVCGESCEDRPRVRNSKGRYFCRECYDKAVARKRLMRDDHSKAKNKGKNAAGKEPDAGAAAPKASGSLGADDWDSPLTDDLDTEEIDRSDESGDSSAPLAITEADVGEGKRERDSTAASTAGVCPNCGADFPLAAIICVECGYNTTTGHTVEANLGGTVVAKEDIPDDTIWPSVIGILAVVFGTGFAGLSVWGLIEMLLGDGAFEGVDVDVDPTTAIIVASIFTLPFVLVMAWHGFAGIGLLQRREWAYRQMLLWAKVICGIVALVWILFAGLMSIRAFMAGGVMELIVMLLISAVIAGVYLAWPVFLILWLSRDLIEAEVEEWG